MLAGQSRRLLGTALAGVAVVGASIWFGGRSSAPGPTETAERSSTSSSTSATPSPATDPPSSTSPTADPAAFVPSDRFVAAPGSSSRAGTGPLRTYAVEVEDGIPVDPAEFAAAVDATLADRRGWTADGTVSLQRVGGDAGPTFRVRLATPATVDAHCAPLQTNGIYSCRQGAEVMINAVRWFEGAAASQLPLAEYRHYVISHEVGHVLGHGHVGCPAPGALAPVMLQQTKGLGGCAPNPWPHPEG